MRAELQQAVAFVVALVFLFCVAMLVEIFL